MRAPLSIRTAAAPAAGAVRQPVGRRGHPAATAASAAASAAINVTVRRYATPVNGRSSLEPSLGTAPPPAPQPVDSAGAGLSEAAKLEQWLKSLSATDASNRSGSQRLTSSLERARNALLRAASQPPLPAAVTRPAPPAPEKLRTVERREPNTSPAPSLRDKVIEAARLIVNVLPARSADGVTPSSSVESLVDLYNQRAGRQLSIELQYESTPVQERRVPGVTSKQAGPSQSESAKDHDDGVLLLAYVSNLSPSSPDEVKVSLCTAFPVAANASDLDAEDEPTGRGALAVSCAHTLTTALPRQTENSAHAEAASIAFAMTRRGEVYAVRTLLASLPQCDLVLLQLSEQPVLVPASDGDAPGFFSRNRIARPPNAPKLFFTPTPVGSTSKPLRTLPLSPYPPHPDEEIFVSSFTGWDSSSSEADSASAGGAYDAADGRGVDQAGGHPLNGRWGKARIIEYKDGAGKEARVGTYDDLHQLDFRLLSAPNYTRPKIASITVPMPDESGLHVTITSLEGAEEEDEETIRKVLPGLARRDNMHLLDKTLKALSQPPQTQEQTISRRNAGPHPSATAFPPPGSSGGPIVSARDGCVVGVVRGSRTSVLEGHRGDGIPAEKIFEMFSLPGLGKKKLEQRKARASSQAQPDQATPDPPKEP